MTRFLIAALQAVWLFAVGTGAALAGNITIGNGGGQVTIGTQRTLTALVTLSPNTVIWSVNGVTGGNSTVGRISSTGVYTAPGRVPPANVVTVKATSKAYPMETGTTTLSIVQLQPHLTAINPTSVPVGAFTLTLSGSQFRAGATARLGGVPLATTRLSSSRLRATGTTVAAQAGTRVAVDVLAPGPGALSSEVLMLAVAGVTPPPPPAVAVMVSPLSASLLTGAAQAFAATVTGSTNTAVTWSVNGVNGGNATVGTISSAGLYTAPATVPSPATVTVRATSVASSSASASASVTVSAPPTGGGTDLASARFLDQASSGPTPADLARVKSLGINGWLNEQFAMPESAIGVPASGDNRVVMGEYVARLSAAPDQLRQRVAYALAQVFVISANKNPYANEVAPFLQILSRNAFGNFRTLLGEVTLSPQMGKYLDMANSNKPAAGSSANENYPRELMQLFTIGLQRLNADGTPVLDAQGRPIPTYTQAEVQQVALALTGWTYVGSGTNNWENFSGPMVPRDVNHDLRAKAFLGCSLPAGQTAQQDLNATLDCIFRHPNVGPFIGLRLIRQLVKSNPSPAYVARVSAVFNNNGSGTRGDLKAVVRAVLTDAEARDDSVSPTGGRLRDPVQQIVALVRLLGGSIPSTHLMGWDLSRAGEFVLAPPSVFGFYSPLFKVPGSTLAGPEFQIYTPTEAVLRGNLMWHLIENPGADASNINLTPFLSLAANTGALVDKANQVLLYGRMPAGLRTLIMTQVDDQGTDARARVNTALYLTALSGLFAVQH